MSGQPNAWKTARPSNTGSSSSRNNSNTPQNRSTAASPAQTSNPTKPPSSNVWTQRVQGNGPAAPLHEEPHTSVNSFNASETKGFLTREQAPSVYKLPGEAGSRSSGSAWGAKSNHMANGQPFFLQLAKQVAAFEGGG